MLISWFLLFALVTAGLAWPLASRLALAPAEKLCANVLLSLLAAYLLAFAIYVCGLPSFAYWVIPLLSAVGLIAGRRLLVALLEDRTVRALLAGQVLVIVWCVGWLAVIASYSGGGWAGDWFEHWQRTRFFLDRLPLDTKFIEQYLLPARPPLANVVTGALLAPVGVTFAGYQVMMTLLNAVAFLPAGLLALRFARWFPGASVRPVAVLAVLLMLNPSFVENATFAWTKLFSAFFILAGIYFFLRVHDADSPPAATPLCAASLAAGILAHYSAGPYVVMLAIAWFALKPMRQGPNIFWRQTGLAIAVGGFLLATWFAWSFVHYGVHTTLASNSSATVQAAWKDHPVLKVALNLRDTLVPHFLRTVDPQLIEQCSAWGYLRDWWFQLYQVNLLFIFGCAAWLVIAMRLVRDFASHRGTPRGFWTGFVPGVIFLGVVVHGARDRWGLAHICLLALVLMGLAFLAARWDALGRGWRMVVVVGAAIDLSLGIALQFGVESYAFDRWFAPNEPPIELLKSYNASAFMNLGGKVVHQLVFLSDLYPRSGAVILITLTATLAVALLRAARAQ